MSRANEPAFGTADPDCPVNNGLTIREHFAAMAMQGLLAAQIHGFTDVPAKGPYASMAVGMADALIAELAKVKP